MLIIDWSMVGSEHPIGTLHGHADKVNRVAFHPSGRFIGSTSFDLTWRLWDIETQQSLLDQEGHSRAVTGIAFQNDGALVATTYVPPAPVCLSAYILCSNHEIDLQISRHNGSAVGPPNRSCIADADRPRQASTVPRLLAQWLPVCDGKRRSHGPHLGPTKEEVSLHDTCTLGTRYQHSIPGALGRSFMLPSE